MLPLNRTVDRACTSGENHSRDEMEREDRYSFLWSEAELERRKLKSWLWTRVGQYKGEISNYYKGFESAPLADDVLARSCVTLEERAKEAIGAVGLTHLAYHSDPLIVGAVADFLAKGVLPEEVRTSSIEADAADRPQ